MNRCCLLIVSVAVAGVSLAPANPPAPDPVAIEEWIEQLTALDSEEMGLSSSVGGLDFPPVEGQAAWIVANLSAGAPPAHNQAIERLVAAGPVALPALLKHVDDRRETKLVVEHTDFIGGMWYATEVTGLQSNRKEAAVLERYGLIEERGAGPRPDDKRHAVTVGDACFVIIGMITNRRYNAVRYQPTACLVINSPTTSPVIAEALRAIWGERPTADDLRAWLLEDFERDDPGAATRLLYYFPDDSAPLVLDRLQRMIKADDNSLPDFVHAIVWYDDPALRVAIRSEVLQTDNPYFVYAGMPAFAEPGDPQRLSELEQLLARWEDRGDPPLERILATAMQAHPEDAARLMESLLRESDHDARLACVQACVTLARPPVEPLRRLLDDRTEGMGVYLIEGEGVQDMPTKFDFLAHRICDNAYVLISRSLGDQGAACLGDRQVMNRRIAELETRLSRSQAEWPFTATELTDLEQQRTAPAREVRERLARIQAQTGSPTEADILTLEDPRLTPERWRRAAARLFNEPNIDERTLYDVVDGLRRKRTLVMGTLSSEDRDRIWAALEMQTRNSLAAAPGEWPTPDGAAYLALAEYCGPGRNERLMRRTADRLAELTEKRGLPREREYDEWRATYLAMDVLLETATPGAADLFANWCDRATPQALGNDFCLSGFMSVLSRHHQAPPIAAAAERMFATKGSPWNPAAVDYCTANEFGDGGLLAVPAFRKALRRALDHEDIVGELCLDEDKLNYCWIWWTNGGSSGQGILAAEPCGVTAGGPRMKLRRCDMLLEGVGNAVFGRHDGPTFHIYWPLARRNEGRAAWREWLARPPEARAE